MARRTRGFARTPVRKSSSKATLACLVLASVTAMVVDYEGRGDSPFEPVRNAVGDAVAPVQEGLVTVARPIRQVPQFFTDNTSMRNDVARLTAENDSLRGQLATMADVRFRAAQLDGLLRASKSTGLALVPARVIGIGTAQSFSHVVTIDAGRSSGISPDMTVVSNAGLVGRVIHAGRSTATVLLIVDHASVVGARLGSNAEIGFLRGRGTLSGQSRVDLDLVDNSQVPGKDDVVTTWGSSHGAPYVAGIPIGTVESVFSSPREQAKHAIIRPYVDFSALDLVGVVVPGDTKGDRTVIHADDVTIASPSTGGN